MNCVYILFSEKLNRYYVGCTSDLTKRLQFHGDKTQDRKYTYKADDWVVFLTLECGSQLQALAVEKHIKRMKSKVYIENLARYPDLRERLLSKYADC